MSEIARAMELVGRKWALLIVDALLNGPRRFTEIERSLGGANPKLVAARLHELVADGIVTRTSYAEVPPRVEYALTERGRALKPAIEALRRFGTGSLAQGHRRTRAERPAFNRSRAAAGRRSRSSPC